MTFDCEKCQAAFEVDYSFGQNVTCPTCKTEYETDWDYTDAMEGNWVAWIVGEAGTKMGFAAEIISDPLTYITMRKHG